MVFSNPGDNRVPGEILLGAKTLGQYRAGQCNRANMGV
jgi:hypothetical protein